MKASECMLCWDRQTRKIAVVKWPDDKRLSSGLSAIGANVNAFRKKTKIAKALALITEGIYLHTNCGFTMEAVVEALRKIDECKWALDTDHFDLGT